jgi:hypothetical protein
MPTPFLPHPKSEMDSNLENGLPKASTILKNNQSTI